MSLRSWLRSEQTKAEQRSQDSETQSESITADAWALACSMVLERLPWADATPTYGGLDRDEFVERVTGWLMPKDEKLAAEARASVSMDGVYTGRSSRILRIARLAYARGVRRGASCAWSAQQPVTTRGNAPLGWKHVPYDDAHRRRVRSEAMHIADTNRGPGAALPGSQLSRDICEELVRLDAERRSVSQGLTRPEATSLWLMLRGGRRDTPEAHAALDKLQAMVNQGCDDATAPIRTPPQRDASVLKDVQSQLDTAFRMRSWPLVIEAMERLGELAKVDEKSQGDSPVPTGDANE